MAYEPSMDGREATNVPGLEHVYKIHTIFGASSAVTYYSKDATIAKTTTTTFTITLPKAYTRVTDFNVGRFAAASVAGLEFIITDKSNLASDGTLVLTSIESDSGSATAPAEADEIWITLGVSDDRLINKFTG